MRIVGYADRLTVRPGERLNFMVSCSAASYEADLVRVRHGDPNPLGPGFLVEPVASSVDGTYAGRQQRIVTGSHVRVPLSPPLVGLGDLTLLAWVFPTLPERGEQGVIGAWDGTAGFALTISPEGLALRIDGSVVATGRPLLARQWYGVAASRDAASGRIRLRQRPAHFWPGDPTSTEAERDGPAGLVGTSATPLLIGALGGADPGAPLGSFDGKIERPTVVARALAPAEVDEWFAGRGDPDDLVACWDFARGIATDRAEDVGPHGLRGEVVNLPTRGVTGRWWSGNEDDHTKAPAEYAAIHFHSDDLEDARWDPDFTLAVPDDVRSSVYAVRLRCEDGEDHVPFFVAPPRGVAHSEIAYLIPTFTYLAYADEHMPIEPAELYPFLGDDLHLAEYAYIDEHRLHSLYDTHDDGSGVCYSSWRRPLVNVRANHVFRVYSSPERLGTDLYLVDWLRHEGIGHDVITDELVHDEGVDLLRRYRVVVTGSHPEYWTATMLDALEAYLAGGGRVMYLGGNGFYWVTGVHPSHPHAIEIRRWRGTETWEASPGEVHLSSTGELGGLWRNRNRAPQKLLGVGFTSQGNDFSRPYRRLPASRDPRAAWIFDGVEGESIGDFPSLMLRHGAAGYEIDRADFSLGTPPHALVLATADGFSSSYQHVIEEVLSTDEAQGGPVDPMVRSDIVFFEGPNGGAVFSVGSIAWLGALSHNGYANDVATVTGNVLRRFASPEPIPAP